MNRSIKKPWRQLLPGQNNANIVYFGNAASLILFVGSVALRPRITPGLPFSKSVLLPKLYSMNFDLQEGNCFQEETLSFRTNGDSYVAVPIGFEA